MGARRVLVCDGNEKALEELTGMMEAYLSTGDEIMTFQEPEEMLMEIKKGEELPTVIFLDMELGKTSGLEVAGKILERHHEIPIIFTGNILADISRIFAVNPVYFLKKPICSEQLWEALKKGWERAQELENKSIVLANRGILYRVKCGSIHYAESSKRVITLMGDREKWTVYMKMDELEKLLPENFLRCHKSYMVNMNQIASFAAEGIILESGRKIPVSRAKYQEARKRFWEYFNELSPKEQRNEEEEDNTSEDNRING